MAILSRDTWTGGDDTDIAGRTPDGGGNGSYAVGSWNERDSLASGRLDIVSGAVRNGLAQDSSYALTGVSTGADYKVEGIFERLTLDTGAEIGVGVRADDDSVTSHYVLYYFQASSTTATIGIWWETSLFNFGFLDEHTISMPAIGVPVKLSLEVEGTALRGYIDDVLEIDVTDTAISAAGYPALWFNGDAGGTAAWECTEFIVSSLETPPPAGTSRSFTMWI